MAPEHRKIWLDGDFIPWADATLHVLSHAAQRGALVFDYMSVHQTERGAAVFRLGDHLARFRHSCEILGLPLLQDDEELRRAALETVRVNPPSGALKISAYLPSIEVELVPLDDHVAVAIAAYDIHDDIIVPNRGEYVSRPTIRLRIERTTRNKRDDILAPQAKVSGGYAPLMAAKWRARRDGFDEILLLDEDGALAETPTTNLFLVDAAGVVRTPAAHRVLHGVTRNSILEIARSEGMEAVEGTLYPDDLERASESFLSATTAGVIPVVSVDGLPIGDGTVGPITTRLGEVLHAAETGADERFAHWVDFVEA